MYAIKKRLVILPVAKRTKERKIKSKDTLARKDRPNRVASGLQNPRSNFMMLQQDEM